MELPKTHLVKSLTPKLMNPKRVLGMKGDDAKVTLGKVLGVAMGVAVHTQPDDTKLTGLRGQFVFISDDEESAKSVRAGQYWPPAGFMEEVFALFEKPAGERPDQVEFGYTVGTMKADHAAGYSYWMEPLIEAGEADPIGQLAARFDGATIAQAPKAAVIEDKAKPKVS